MRRLMPSFADCRWVPWAMAGCFLIVFAVNGALAYFALHSDNGLVTEHPFELGNGYNEVLARGAAQDALGWHATIKFAPKAGLDGRLVARFTDKGGAPLAGLRVNVDLVRPIEPLPERVVTLQPAGDGTYEAPVVLARPGQWELRVTALRDGASYEFAERVVTP
ncbi:MAG TPA: FixH family protein [Stellaceae bacterium]|nr:FixH family protein [Stellaceae bacterium]